VIELALPFALARYGSISVSRHDRFNRLVLMRRPMQT
jgi:hypothetical protein